MIEPVFKIILTENTENSIVAILSINADSDIFKGHFPGQPVVPGACMLQTVKEIVSDKLEMPLRLLKADNIKFLGLVEPGTDQFNLSINYQITDEQIKITANLSSGETVYMKLQGGFVKA